MPADDALRSDQDQVPAPVTAASAGHHPEQLVAGVELRSLPGRPGQYRELMTEQEILGDECLAVTGGRTDKAEEEKEILEHRPNIMPLSARSCPGRLFAPSHPSGAGVRGVPVRKVSLSEVLNEGLQAEETFQSRGAYTGACHTVLVEVDPETASVQILRYAVAHDCGQVINPLLVHGQLQGGLVHGVGYALMEEAVYLPDGTFATANLADYALPGRGLPPAITPELIEVHAPVLGENPKASRVLVNRHDRGPGGDRGRD